MGDFWEVEKKVAFSWTWDFFLFIIYIEKWQKSPQNVWPHKKCGKNRKNFLTLKIEKKWFKSDFEAKKKNFFFRTDLSWDRFLRRIFPPKSAQNAIFFCK